MANGQLWSYDIVRILKERSRNTSGCPADYRRRFFLEPALLRFEEAVRRFAQSP